MDSTKTRKFTSGSAAAVNLTNDTVHQSDANSIWDYGIAHVTFLIDSVFRQNVVGKTVYGIRGKKLHDAI